MNWFSFQMSLYRACLYGLVITIGSCEPTVKLSSGYDIPIIELGTWQIKPDKVDVAVTAALENGYKHIDTAYLYGNEKAIGKSLKKWFDKGGKRNDIFITTKLPPTGNRAAAVKKYLKASLKSLGLEYVDMYLIHQPVGFLPNVDGNGLMLDFATDLIAVWKAMEAQVRAGRARSIGISNFNESQVLNIINNSEIKPSNLQVELHAFNQQKPLRELCAKHNIAVTGYSPLGSPGSAAKASNRLATNLMQHPIIMQIAEAHKKSKAQVLLRYSVQNGIIVIPKSTNPERLKANHDIFDFELTADQMKQIENLDKAEEGRMFNFLNFFKGIERHPEYPWPAQIKNL